MQKKYWKYMVQIKHWIFYLDLYAENSYKWDKIINLLGAIASSTSIAAWTIWQQLSYLWSVIIAVDTRTTDSVASYWEENGISVVACRKDSIENAIG